MRQPERNAARLNCEKVLNWPAISVLIPPVHQLKVLITPVATVSSYFTHPEAQLPPQSCIWRASAENSERSADASHTMLDYPATAPCVSSNLTHTVGTVGMRQLGVTPGLLSPSVVTHPDLKRPCDWLPEGDWPNGELGPEAPPEVRLAQGIAIRFNKYRKKTNLKEVAKQTRVSRPTLYGIIDGTTWPNIVTVARLEMRYKEMIFGNEHRPRTPKKQTKPEPEAAQPD